MRSDAFCRSRDHRAGAVAAIRIAARVRCGYSRRVRRPVRASWRHDMNVNIWAVLAAAISSFVLGGLWYGPLFKAAWCREAGIDPHSKPKHPGMVFGAAFVLSLLAAYVFALFLGHKPVDQPEQVWVEHSVMIGLIVGVCWVATSFGINYLFAARSLKLWAIDAGYHTLQFALYGLVLGLWH
jgi:hypothetical protein